MLAKIIVILGPTSSGKSELAVKIAKISEIISADSRQFIKALISDGKIKKKWKVSSLPSRCYFAEKNFYR